MGLEAQSGLYNNTCRYKICNPEMVFKFSPCRIALDQGYVLDSNLELGSTALSAQLHRSLMFCFVLFCVLKK